MKVLYNVNGIEGKEVGGNLKYKLSSRFIILGKVGEETQKTMRIIFLKVKIQYFLTE